MKKTSRDIRKKYYIGLSVGTSFAGWAVTDKSYCLLKARSQPLWGSYLFDEAKSAKERRLHRSARRRRARTRQRLLLLQDLFAEEIAKKDPLFFLRLNNSSLFLSDKAYGLRSADSLFGDETFKDRDFFRKYPTVYHLRAALIRGEIEDVRFLYLGVHHILKKRGHFLFEVQGDDVQDTSALFGSLGKINVFLTDHMCAPLDLSKSKEILNILCDAKADRQSRRSRLIAVIAADKNLQHEAIARAISGSKFKLRDLTASDQVAESRSFSFEDANFEESGAAAIEKEAGEEWTEFVLLLKAVYDWTVFFSFMGARRFLSEAKVDAYEKHREDLRRLKAYVREKCPEKYGLVFYCGENANNYAAYVGSDRKKRCARCTKGEFYSFLKRELRLDDKQMLRDMGKDIFLPLQSCEANGAVPYQAHLQELNAILKYAEEKFPFLKERSGGTSVSDKIRMLMTFRVPYYVGPLDTRSPFGWAVRRQGCERERVTPWNFGETVDEAASEERFIRRSTNKCAYLAGQDVLPVNSLLYCEFFFLNELNQMKICGEQNEAARRAIYEFAKYHKRFGRKEILTLLIREGIVSPDSKEEEIFGSSDRIFRVASSSWVNLAFLGEKRIRYSAMCEEVLLWITLISDKERLEKRIRAKYGKFLSEEEIKKLKSLNSSRWSRVSREFLNGIVSEKCLDENGRPMTLIEAMRKTGKSFSELMSDAYGFGRAVDRYNAENVPSEAVNYAAIRSMYCSMAVKRAIWRSIELVREIVEIEGAPPERLFLETTSGNARRGQNKFLRKNELIARYRALGESGKEFLAAIEKTPEVCFNSDRLYLYYLQEGKSAYSGTPIRLKDVFDADVCDIDHIYPQSKIQEESIDNKVLVFRAENVRKKDVYPLPSSIQSKCGGFWKECRKVGLMSEVKYARLTRTEPLTDAELTSYIERQFCLPDQHTRSVMYLLQKLLPDTEIVYVRSSNADRFRQDNGLIRMRDLNNLSYAKDAYIDIAVGNVYRAKFKRELEKGDRERLGNYNIRRLFDEDIEGEWKVSDRQTVLQTVVKNNARVVRMTEQGKGALFNATIKKAGANKNLIPLKGNGAFFDTSKYGGYDSETTAYFMLVRSNDKRGGKRLSLEAFPLWQEKLGSNSVEDKIRYCEEKAGLNEAEILIPQIKINTLFQFGGSYAYLRGRSGNRLLWCNANEPFLEQESLAALKPAVNFIRARDRFGKGISVGKDVNAEGNLALYDKLLDKLASPVYAGLTIRKQLALLSGKREDFAKLTPEGQCKVLTEVLRLMQCNSATSDLTLLGGAANAGKIVSSKFVDGLQMKMILQSPTGYYRKVISFDDV